VIGSGRWWRPARHDVSAKNPRFLIFEPSFVFIFASERVRLIAAYRY